MEKQIVVGDWVRVIGEGPEAFQIEWVNKDSVGLKERCCAVGLYKVILLDLDKYGITTHTVHYWYKKKEV